MYCMHAENKVKLIDETQIPNELNTASIVDFTFVILASGEYDQYCFFCSCVWLPPKSGVRSFERDSFLPLYFIHMAL